MIMLAGAVVVGLAIGVLVALVVKAMVDSKVKRTAEREAQRIIQKAKAKASKIEKESKDKAHHFEKKIKRNAEEGIKKEKDKVKDLEKSYNQKLQKIQSKEQSLQDKTNTEEKRIEAKEKEVENREKRTAKRYDELEVVKKEFQTKLETVGGMTQDQAKKELVSSLEEEAKRDLAKSMIAIEEEAKEEAEAKAKRIISIAIARFAGGYTAEKTTSVLPLPSEDMKGKVIGKEGRNIRAFESLCGVDLILDEVPDSVVISAFDPVRREVARRALEALFADGRIHPAMIEQAIHKVKKELFKSIREDGEKACFELGITNMHKEITDLIGSLKYRLSYTQNNYSHSIEVGMLCGMMAAELGEDVKEARRAGLLHDVGKALDHSIEGSHAIIGADFIKKRGEKSRIVHAVRAHHYEEEPSTILAHLVIAADAISGARPGARKSTQANYFKRLEDLETIGNSFDGVLRTFAIQAGREIRVIVDSAKINDEQSVMLSRDIAKKITKEMNYPGQIKVIVVREMKAIEHAR
ncbi:MAG: ribonuclease Y [Bdellovibrionales bacterium]